VVLDIAIGLATVEDAIPIARMTASLIEAGLPHAWTYRRVVSHVRSSNSVVVTARDKSFIAGFAIMHFGDDSAHLNLLAVEPGYRRRGLGSRLIGWLEDSSRVAGVQFISLEVRSSNHRALSFYSSLGYRETGIIPGYYSGIDDATLLARDLRVDEFQET
jgi:ribosomal-protein-alanine N-acetyltransferase